MIETVQSEVMAMKHKIVLGAMLSPEKLIQLFKCAGRYCSYTTNIEEDALLHASTHKRIGGEDSLKCAYSNFDAAGSATNLVKHIFENYSHCTYACSKCFYRAACSTLVHAHIKRFHTDLNADNVPVLSSATHVSDNTPNEVKPRSEAVLYYTCNNRDDRGDVCRYKSYVWINFCEHLYISHTNDEEYPCYMCNTITSSPRLLAEHLITHGIGMYQCCYCVFGADKQSQFMAHASEHHAMKQPLAYLRTITSKGGRWEIRVLPLAVYINANIKSTAVTPSNKKESPVKEAKKSIALEKMVLRYFR